MKKYSLFMLALFLMSVGFVSCGGSKSSSPGTVVVESFELLPKKEYAKIAKLYAKDNGEMLTDEELKKMEGMMAMAASEYDKNEGIKEISVTEENIAEDGNSAIVKYEVVYNDGSKDSDKANLIKIDGKWYLTLKL